MHEAIERALIPVELRHDQRLAVSHGRHHGREAGARGSGPGFPKVRAGACGQQRNADRSPTARRPFVHWGVARRHRWLSALLRGMAVTSRNSEAVDGRPIGHPGGSAMSFLNQIIDGSLLSSERLMQAREFYAPFKKEAS